MTVLCFLLLIASYVNGQSDTKSSLTFVIDVTLSMRSVRDQVKAHAHGIFDAVVRSNESDIDNFVLVTFADSAALITSVNNVTITKNRDEFKDALSLILVSGVDCPEYSMSGIMTGIENSKSGTTMYVFTDASAKDYEIYDQVKDKALKKEIRIIFVLTGSCSNGSKKGYDVYNWLANDTSGQVFNLHKHRVSDILDWITYSVVSRRILLKAKSFAPGDVLFLNYTTDLATRDTSISVSGCDKGLVVTGPDGKKLELKDLVHLKNILVVKVNETKPGTHSVAFDCKTKTRLVVTAKSDIQFRHGFSGFVPTNLNDTTVKPSPDGKTFLSIKISGNFLPKTVNFVDAYDNVIPDYSLPLKPLNETEDLFVTGPFDTPFSMFRIIVTGLDLDHNTTISRIGYTFVEPQNPYLDKIINKKPIVAIEGSPKILIESGSFLQLKCTVNAYPKPNITWDKDGTILETNVFDYDLPYAYVSVYKMVNVNENSTFMCKANNSEGEDKQRLLVEIKPKVVFEVLERPENVIIKYNDLVHLKCKVNAYPHANVTWYKNGVSLSKEYGITEDGSELMIQHMKLVNEGNYSCNLKNKLQEEDIRFEIKISGVDTPKIVNTSDNLNFKEGTNNTIVCRLEKGTPEPTIHWYFDNGLGKYDEIVEAMDDEHLIISHVNRKQAGKYKCVAINELGTDMMETNVIVEYPPTIDIDTKLVTANAGDEVVLACSADGVPEPNFTWTRDGKPLAGSKFTSSSDHRLIFAADMVDTGVYKCKASNKLGSSEKAVVIKVNKAPTSVILEGSSIDAEYDEPLTLTCKILAFPKPDIFWVTKSGKTEIKYVIEEKSVYHYVSYLDIDRVTTNATYQCKTNNTLGSDEAEITVITAKKTYFNILENPEDKNHNIQYNDKAVFFCKVDAYPPAEVNWYKDGGVLVKDDLSVSSNGSVLTITHMQRVDQGTYMCEANNSNTRFSFPFKITISGLEKPKIHHAPKNMNVNEKTNTTIICRIDAGIPKPSIRWFYKGTSSGYVEIVDAKDSGYFPLTNIDRRDQGTYKCDANNSEGTDWMETSVIVEYPPTIYNDTEPITAKAGEEVTLKCTADGVPKPILQWTKDDIPLKGSKFTVTSDQRITFDVGLNDTGVYKCDASNRHGSTSKTIDVEVHHAPIIHIKEKHRIDADIGEPINITCEVIGFPKPDITWINITGKSELKSKIHEITPYHFVSRLNLGKVASKTTFQCKANNSLGANEDKIDIIVKPFFKDLQCPKDKTHDIGFNKTALFVCKVDAYPPAQVIWYKNWKVFPNKDLSVSSDGRTLTIKHMQPVDQGRYKCEVKNSITSSECAFAIRMSGIVKPKIFASLKTMNAVENSSVIIHCRIEKGTPLPTIKWYHKDIEIGEAKDLEDLSFTNIKRGDQGNYKCIATNFAGNATRETILIVEYAPKMIDDVNQTLSFLVDTKVMLTCLADGVPKPTISWSKDDSPLNSLKFSTNSDDSLEFDLGLDDRGTYQCMAANYLGTAIKSVTLEVDTPPTVLIEGDSKQRVDYNGFLQLKCYVHAHPAPEIRWTDTTSLKALFAPTFAINPPYGYVSILNITKAAKNTTYQCGAENIHGDHKSSVIVDVGIKTYFNIIDTPRDTIIPYHTQGHLYCNIDAYPPAKITWYKDLKEITNKYGLIVTDGKLTFKNMEPFQRGRYTCEAKNSEITKTFVAKVEVSGLESPKILRTLTEKTNIREVLVRDVNITLSCIIEKGIPKPAIKWMYKNQHTLKYVKIKDATDQETYSLTVSGDTLQYACEVSNLLGFDSLKMNLKLPVNKVIKKKGKKRRILVAGTPNELKLKCTVQKSKNLPRPKIKWIYKGTKDNPKDELLFSEDGDNSKYHTTTFKSYNVTYDRRGFYSCIATDYFGIQSSDTFIVDVNTPPEILNRVKVVRAVVGDPALSIHCIATGHPEPEYRWTYGGVTEEGGTLTLYNITTYHADFYNRTATFGCEAYNSVGADYAKFEVIIDDYPSLDNPNSTLKLELGKDVPLACPIPHEDGDLLRWYKNNKKLTDGELKIDNAKVSDAGLYTCRVSSANDSRSANVHLEVGTRLVFTNTDVRAKISPGVGEVVALDCNAMGVPYPRVSWFHNGKAIPAIALYYRFKMNNANSGIYKCDVVNDFDTISRTFDVVLNECLLKIDPNDRRQPLILTQRFTSPTYKYEDGFLYMPQNQSIILTCGTNGSFNYFPYDYINAFCNVTAKLEIEGDYDFSDLKCNKEVTPYVKWTGKACQGEDSEMIEIGYEIRTKTLAVYESCMDILNDVPFYTKQSMRLPIAEVIPKGVWFEDRLKNNFEAMYDVDEQINSVTSTLGFWFHKVDRCVFTQRQLVDPQGVFPGVPQGATFTHLNVVPQWSSCSTKNWDDVESRVRNLLKSTDELTVWTGTAEKLSLKDSYLNAQEIFLTDPKSRASPSPVSTYLWKVVQNRAKNASLAIIQINVPDMKPSDVYSFIKCRDVCRRTNWMNSLEWSKINRGYVFCCTLDKFEYTFGYRGSGIFGRGMDKPLLHI